MDVQAYRQGRNGGPHERTMDTSSFIRPALESDLPAILVIYNEVIANTTAAYVYDPHTLEMRREWYADLKQAGWPVIVAERNGAVAGFGCIGPFRTKPGYKYTGEHTLHVHRDHRGTGIGKALLRALIDEADTIGLRTLIGGIDAENTVSLELHARLGFVECARVREAGFKFDRWLDLVLMQLLLPGPDMPVDG
jgi:L-amino acid N-acyltransferase YncA